MKMRTVLASLLAFGLASVAHAGINPASLSHADLMKLMSRPTTTLKVSATGVKVIGERPFCDPPGERCYQDDSWTCCSGICIDSICH
jgi:hypothetical protein